MGSNQSTKDAASNEAFDAAAKVHFTLDASANGCTGMFWRSRPDMGASVSAPDWPRNGAKLQGWKSQQHPGWVKVDHPNGYWLPIEQTTQQSMQLLKHSQSSALSSSRRSSGRTAAVAVNSARVSGHQLVSAALSSRVSPAKNTSSIITRSSVSDEASTATKKKEGWWNKDLAPNMKDVGSIQELVDELADNRDKLVIVEYYAPWCNACRAVFPKLCKMMTEHVDDVLFLKVSFEDNKDMCKTMNVKVLPWFQLYRGAEGRVDQFSCTISKIQRLKDAIELYTAPYCSLEEPPGVEEFPEIRAHADDIEYVHPDADKPTDLKRVAWS